jgi:type I restriction enzyme M protein
MANDAAALVQKFWNFCNVLRDDGVSYGDYVEQLTYLLFLKMAEEQKHGRSLVPADAAYPRSLDWESLAPPEDGDALETHYRHILTTLGKGEGWLGLIFRKSQNKIQDPAKLKRLITLIDQEMWSALNADVKSDLYEGLLEKNAQDVKGGAGQYFTPRELIRAMVDGHAPGAGDDGLRSGLLAPAASSSPHMTTSPGIIPWTRSISSSSGMTPSLAGRLWTPPPGCAP